MNEPTDYKLQTFESCRHRLQYLEKWLELAIRPSKEDCNEIDKDLLSNENDDLNELRCRCANARENMNANITDHESEFENDLVIDTSQIPKSGDGLFFRPTCTDPSSSVMIRKGEVICYYYGKIHNFASSKKLLDRSYLMLVEGSMFVDPKPLPHIKARYINDPINEVFYNCKYVPQPKAYRSAVIATRDIDVGEEIFASYGSAYWAQKSYDPCILASTR